MAETTKGFWHTVLGMLTAIAALITALGGILGILIQNDVIGPGVNDQQSAAPKGGNAPQGDGHSDGATPGVTSTQFMDPSALVPWEQATATLVRQDGTSTTVKASTVSVACDFPETLKFENGQRISLELVRSIEFNTIYTEDGSADGVITLWEGRQLTDSIFMSTRPVSGTNELGQVGIEIGDIKRIDFNR